MLYIIFGVAVLLAIICAIIYENSRYGSDITFAGVVSGFVIAVLTLIIWGIVYSDYNSIATTADSRLKVLQEQNEVVVSQVTPIVMKYTEYESGTLQDFKMSPEKVVALCAMYPELKSNEFFKAQIDIIVNNQKEITKVKLEKASLNAYHFWLFTPIQQE